MWLPEWEMGWRVAVVSGSGWEWEWKWEWETRPGETGSQACLRGVPAGRSCTRASGNPVFCIFCHIDFLLCWSLSVGAFFLPLTFFSSCFTYIGVMAGKAAYLKVWNIWLLYIVC